MTPTNQLRFVMKNFPVTIKGEVFDNWQKVLQQWHFNDFNHPTQNGEWKDVPLEEEK